MKVLITENEHTRTYDVDLDWTFEEADLVKQVAGIRAGEVFAELLRGDAMTFLAVAIVGRMRNEPGFDATDAWLMKHGKVDLIEVKFDDGKDDTGGPPAGAGEKPAGPAVRKSRRKS